MSRRLSAKNDGGESRSTTGHAPPADSMPAEGCGTPGLFDRVLLFVGSLAYLGYVPFASGTVAVAVVGVPVYWLLVEVLSWGSMGYSVFVLAFTLLSVWIAGHADRVLNEKDSKKNVIDELPGYWIALWGLPFSWKLVVLAFFLERTIDIAKLWPARWIEQKWPRGWGVVMDDVLAGLYTLAILRLGCYWRPEWFGVA